MPQEGFFTEGSLTPLATWGDIREPGGPSLQLQLKAWQGAVLTLCSTAAQARVQSSPPCAAALLRINLGLQS